jgi:ParB family chromosome partitioning protein
MIMERNNQKVNAQTELPLPQVVPKGILIHLSVDQVKPNPNNPRRLFDPGPLSELRESIRIHGVLVPITVYKLPGQDIYGIVDGERRYRCCVDLYSEGINIEIPSNVVEAPDQMASLVYMFNIHAFREPWELMPTALSLQQVMKELGTDANKELNLVTGLGLAQIERCKKILSFDERYQRLSLAQKPKERIPSNFWVELYPVLELAPDVVPELYADVGRDGITDRMVEKYRAKKIKSVIHFRRILEAFEVAEDKEDKEAVADRLREYILTPELETREAFDGFIKDTRKIQRAVTACDKFIKDISRAKVDYSIEGKDELIEKFMQILDFVQKLIDKLVGDQPPMEDEESDQIED